MNLVLLICAEWRDYCISTSLQELRCLLVAYVTTASNDTNQEIYTMVRTEPGLRFEIRAVEKGTRNMSHCR
jgi:hypothetical protein